LVYTVYGRICSSGAMGFGFSMEACGDGKRVKELLDVGLPFVRVAYLLSHSRYFKHKFRG